MGSDPGEILGVRIELRVSVEWQTKVKAAAAKEKLSLSEYIRRAVMAQVDLASRPPGQRQVQPARKSHEQEADYDDEMVPLLDAIDPADLPRSKLNEEERDVLVIRTIRGQPEVLANILNAYPHLGNDKGGVDDGKMLLFFKNEMPFIYDAFLCDALSLPHADPDDDDLPI